MSNTSIVSTRNDRPVSAKTRHIIGLWSTPRSVSTAFEKTFTQRDDTATLHEPFTDCYYFSKDRRSSRYGTHDHLHEYTGTRAIADIDRLDAPIVFFKDLAFQAIHYLTDAFLMRITNTFIVRHPREVLASLLPLKPDFTEEEFGFGSLSALFTVVTERCGQTPIVIDAVRFRKDPEGVLQRFCTAVGVAFDQRMLHWDDGRLRDWQPHEAESQAKWHRTLAASRSILPPTDVSALLSGDQQALVARWEPAYESLTRHAL